MAFSVILALLGVISAALGEPLPLLFAVPLMFKLGSTIDELEDRIYFLEEMIYDSRTERND